MKIKKEVSFMARKAIIAREQKEKPKKKSKVPRGKGMAVGFEIYNICCWTR